MRLILIFGGLHLCVMGLGAVMLLMILREGRLGRADEKGDPPGGGGPPPDEAPPPRSPRPPGGLGLPLANVVPARVRLREHGRGWPRPGRLRAPPCDPRPAPARCPFSG